MKRLIEGFITMMLILVIHVSYSQTLQKGSLLGLHYGYVNLNPDVTMNQFKTFYISTVIPDIEKNMPGVKVIVAKGLRGENENAFAVMYLFDSEATRNKYFGSEGAVTDAGKSAMEKTQATSDKLSKMGTMTTKYTDWLIQ